MFRKSTLFTCIKEHAAKLDLFLQYKKDFELNDPLCKIDPQQKRSDCRQKAIVGWTSGVNKGKTCI